MGLKTAQKHKRNLNDEGIVYCKGEKKGNGASNSDLSVCLNTIAIDYEISRDPLCEAPSLSKRRGDGWNRVALRGYTGLYGFTLLSYNK